MRNGMKPFWREAQLVALAMLGSAFLWLTPSANAASAPSSPQDRARFVSIAKKLEAAPLDPKLTPDREWALGWLAEIPDIQVSICAAPLAKWDQPDYRYKSEILYQYVFSMGTFLIENPGKADDRKSQYLAGVEGALRAYRVILQEMPDAKSAGLDSLADMQARGDLNAFMVKATIQCSAGKGQPT